MSSNDTSVSSIEVEGPGPRVGSSGWSIAPASADTRITRRLALGVFLFGALVALLYRPFSHYEVGDPAVYDYIAQSILRGQLPYRDVVDIKWPCSSYLSAGAMLIGQAVGLRDVLAVRLLYILLIGALSALIYLVSETYLGDRLVAIIACTLPLISPRFHLWMIGGTEPKMPMVIFGLLSLLLLAKDRPFWAGVCSMLACLSWQPGLMFTGVAFLIASRYLTSWRDLKAVKVAIGASVPLVAMLGYFYWQGALDDLWSWTIVYNYSVFGPDARRSTLEALDHIAKVVVRVMGVDTIAAGLGLLGFLGLAVVRVRRRLRTRGWLQAPDLFRDAILIPPAVYFLFSIINFQAGRDIIPFVPFVAMFAAWFAVAAIDWLCRQQWLRRKFDGESLAVRARQIAAILIVLVTLGRGALYRLEGWSLRDQDEKFRAISAVLEPQDRIYVHGTTEILVLLNKPNLNPYLFLDWGADEFAARNKLGGFKSVVEEMAAEKPKVVALSRLKVVSHRADFEEWVRRDYEPLDVGGYEGVYVRKEAVKPVTEVRLARSPTRNGNP